MFAELLKAFYLLCWAIFVGIRTFCCFQEEPDDGGGMLSIPAKAKPTGVNTIRVTILLRSISAINIVAPNPTKQKKRQHGGEGTASTKATPAKTKTSTVTILLPGLYDDSVSASRPMKQKKQQDGDGEPQEGATFAKFKSPEAPARTVTIRLTDLSDDDLIRFKFQRCIFSRRNPAVHCK